MKMKKKQKNSIPVHIKIIIKDGEKKFNCEFCKKTFKSRNQRYYHLYCDDISKSPHKCKTCKKAFLSSYHLKYHQQTHKVIENEKYACKKCDKQFSRIQSLNKHSKEHDNEKNDSITKYNCDKCEAVFKDKIAYLGHIQKHNNIFSYTCNECNKNFTIKSNFKQHLLIHTERKNFKCEKCPKTFARKTSYETHLLRHEDQRNYICVECSKSFVDQKTLNRHKTIHNDIAERIMYKCSLCGVKSKRKDNLIRHLRNVHSENNTELKDGIIQIEKGEKINKSLFVDEINSKSCSSTLLKNLKNNSICIPEKNNDTTQIIYNSSVIRSIGNVEPVYIPNIMISNTENNLRSNNNISTMSTAALNTNTNNTVTTTSSSSSTITTTNYCQPTTSNTTPNSLSLSSSLPKKSKKKYDPCEIYRKILLASNDDDSVAESEDITAEDEDHSVSCCIEPNNVNTEYTDTEDYNKRSLSSPLDVENTVISPTTTQPTKTTTSNEFFTHSNFTEIHWRKRTSQYFLNL